MTREEWTRIKDIVAEAIACAPDDRPAFLAAACGPDASLRRETESLLGAVVRAEGLYEHGPLRVGGADTPSSVLDGLIDSSAGGPLPAEHAFLGTARYGVLRRIGAGGMGVVYEVDDRVRRQVVALKTLRRWEAGDIYRLKQEFRSLSDIAHRNLASFYDLVVDDHLCFFTMELVDGVPLVEYVRAGSATGAIERVRRVLPQLIEGVRELHQHGTLHRDLKPSNILVTREGRVVVLDFGLAASLLAGSPRERGLVGTPAYLSPEQCDGGPLTDASDWYSVGVTLYHALTGQLPFEGPLTQLLRQKTLSDPAPVRALLPDVPADLEAVCMGFLRREPATRMRGEEALGWLRGAGPAAAVAARPAARAAFIGRESYVEVLETAFDQVRRGQHASVFLHGPPGIGKSALLQHVVEGVRRDAGAVVLRSRCHEHESVPYKGLDGVVDDLSRYLRALPPAEVRHLLPSDASALARLFPVMQGVGHLDAADAETPNADPVALRRQAFGALRELLARVAARQPLVVEIDDFHWADVESATALMALLQPPHPPALLLLVSFRSEELAVQPFLQALLDGLDGTTGRALALAPMTDREVIRLFDVLLLSNARGDGLERAAMTREAGGNPFLVEELARSAAIDPGEYRGATIEGLLRRRLAALSDESRAFLDTLAVCGRPIDAARVFEACGLTGDERPLVALLRTAHFLRSSPAAGRVEMYHDRVRETLAAAVPPDAVRRIHGRMADVLVAHGDDDPESLFEHYRASGQAQAAAVQAAAAAGKANAVLAFDRAASYLRHALALHPGSGRTSEWTAALAAALENAGRPVDAAETYLEAAQHPHDAQRLEWQRKAAELFLIGGWIDHGLQVSEDVLRAAGVRPAPGPASAVASLVIRRLQLHLRGLDVVPRPRKAIPSGDLLRIDACWSITVGLAMVDPLRAAEFNVRQLLWALDVGDPDRVARALALEGGFSRLVGVGAIRDASEFYARAEALATVAGRDYVAGLSAAWAGIGAFLSGRWTEATEHCRRAVTILQERCTGVTWELNLAHGFFLYSLMYRGEFREAAGHLSALLVAARERGNVYLELELSTRTTLVWLAADDPDHADRRADDAIAQWRQQGFQRPHYHHLLALVLARLYRGRARDAWDLLERHRHRLKSSSFRRVQHTRIETANYLARCALARAAAGDDASRMQVEAARQARRILQERMPWADAFAGLITAAVAYQQGRLDAAAGDLAVAIAGFDAADMNMYAAAGRRRLAAIVGGERGRTLRADSDAWFDAQDIRDPAAMSRVVAPGFPD